MRLVATFHPPTCVIRSLKCNLTDEPVEHLLLAKPSRVEVHSLLPEGLRHECGVDIWGRIIALRAVPVPGSRRCNVLVMLDHPDPQLLFFKYEASATGSGMLRDVQRVPLYERSPRQSEFFNDVLLHHSGKLGVVSCYAGKLKFLFLNDGMCHSDVDVPIIEINLLSVCFLDTDDPFSIAMLFLDNKERVQLHARDICDDIKASRVELSPGTSSLLLPTLVPPNLFYLPDAVPSLIPVPPLSKEGFAGGVLIVGGMEIVLYEVAPVDSQLKHRGRQERLRQKRKSLDKTKVDQAKEKEREIKRRRAKATITWPWSNVTAWCEAGQNPSRYLIGDVFGRIQMLWLEAMAPERSSLQLVHLGEASPPACLTYLSNQVLFLGSYLGDSQLLRVEITPVSLENYSALPLPPDVKAMRESDLLLMASSKGKAKAESSIKGSIVSVQGRRLSVLESFKNISPISDAVLVDPDGSQQPSVVTCSGAGNTGSINVIRKGTDFEKSAIIEGFQNVINIWPIRAHFEDEFDTHILVSTTQESVLLRLGLSHVETSANGFVTDVPTLAFSNVLQRIPKTHGQNTSRYLDSSLVVQVTPTAVTVCDFDFSIDAYTRVHQWTTGSMAASDPTWRDREIVAASINPSQIVLGLSGSRLAICNMSESGEIRATHHDFLGHEIAAVSCAPLDPQDKWSIYIVVAFWVSHRVEILRLDADTYLAPVCRTTLPALPRSVLLYKFDNSVESSCHPRLLAALADGTLMHAEFKDNSLCNEKFISLGVAPVSLAATEVGGKKALFLCGSRPATLAWDRESLQHSPVLLKDIVAASRLHSQSFPSCLIVAVDSGLLIGHVRDINKLHIRTVTLGLDNPRKIAHHPGLKVLGVGCLRTIPMEICQNESSTSSLRLLDDATFHYLTRFDFDDGEVLTALQVLTVACGDASDMYFCAGTSYRESEDHEASKGRLIVFDPRGADSSMNASQGLQLAQKASVNVRGCVSALTSLDGKIVVAINASVVVYTMDETEVCSVTQHHLHKSAEWNHNYRINCLVSRGSTLIVGDAISSISMLTLEGQKLRAIARDYAALWPISVEALDETTVIGANADFNLFTFNLQTSGTHKYLERSGYYHIDEDVTKLLPGALTPPKPIEDTQLTPKQLFFCNSGRIGVILEAGHELSLQLTALQRNMAEVIEGCGGSNHTIYRAPRTSKGRSDAEMSVGFLDGDFLERLLSEPPEMLERIQEGKSEAERLAMPIGILQRTLEIVQNMH